MENKTIFFFFSFLLFIGCNSNSKEQKKIIEKYDNGKTKKEIIYLHDKSKTKEIEYFESGNKQSEIVFLNGKKNGPWTIWYSNGRFQTGEYTNGKIKGVVVDYDSIGFKHREILELGDSLTQMIYYHRNGIIQDLSFSINGTQCGKWYTWYDNGMLQIISDSWNGTYIEYHKNGLKKLEYEFTTPRTKENKKFWNQSGQLIKEEYWDKRELVRAVEHKKNIK